MALTDAVITSKKLEAAISRLAKLESAHAMPNVIARAQRAVDEISLDIQEKRDLARADARQKALAEQKETTRRQHEAEVLFRIGPAVPLLRLALGKIVVTVSPARSTDRVVRGFCYKDFHQAMQIADREGEAGAGLARTGHAYESDSMRIATELADVMRKSIHAGCTEIQIGQ